LLFFKIIIISIKIVHEIHTKGITLATWY